VEETVPRYRDRLPQLNDQVFLTDGGLETYLIFIEGVDLPGFASFPLVMNKAGRDRLRSYFEPYLRTAQQRGAGFVLDTATWRANADWGARLGYSVDELAAINRQSVEFAAELRDEFDHEATPVVIAGVLGPRGDGYKAGERMTAGEAARYHREQIEAFRDTEADMISAVTMTYSAEATGIVWAALACRTPVAISFTVETDGRLPSGETLADAITDVDSETTGAAAYFMVNCSHPTHLGDLPEVDAPWRSRVRGLRANASVLSHAELDAATTLDSGNPAELGQQYRSLRRQMPGLSVLGGCCGTDHRHIAAICEACLPN
jgi:homocysteine S-methyltransferase